MPKSARLGASVGPPDMRALLLDLWSELRLFWIQRPQKAKPRPMDKRAAKLFTVGGLIKEAP